MVHLPRRPERLALQAKEDETTFEGETLAALDRVYRFALQLTKDPADSDDLVQDTYLRAYRSRHQYRLGTNCAAWLFTICHNVWIQKSQRESRITTYENSELDEIASTRRHQNGVVDLALRRIMELPEFDEVLSRALTMLPEIYRTPVVIVDVEDQTYDAAATILNVPIGTVRSRLFRGRRLLQQHLIAYAQDAGLVMSGRAIARPA